MKEVLGYDIMDGTLVNSSLITELIYPVASVYKSSLLDQDRFILIYSFGHSFMGTYLQKTARQRQTHQK